MNAIFHIFLMCLFPFIIAGCKLVSLRKLKLRKMHDRMLYRLCAVRDEAAYLAIEERISEKSALFSIFYVMTANVIHVHDSQHMGVCFRSLIRAFDAASASRVGSKHLYEELSQPIPEIQTMAVLWCKAIQEGYEAAYPIIKIDRAGRLANALKSTLLKKVLATIAPSPEEESVYQFSQNLSASLSPSDKLLIRELQTT